MPPLFIYIDAKNPSSWKNHPTYKNAKINEDVGLDVPMQSTVIVPPDCLSFKVDLEFVGEPNHGYLLVPRSSLGSKTSLRMSNSIGIMDKSYRGTVIAVVDNIGNEEVILQEGACYFQIVSFDGKLPKYQLKNVDPNTNRGAGGFGSTTD